MSFLIQELYFCFGWTSYRMCKFTFLNHVFYQIFKFSFTIYENFLRFLQDQFLFYIIGQVNDCRRPYRTPATPVESKSQVRCLPHSPTISHIGLKKEFFAFVELASTWSFFLFIALIDKHSSSSSCLPFNTEGHGRWVGK